MGRGPARKRTAQRRQVDCAETCPLLEKMARGALVGVAMPRIVLNHIGHLAQKRPAVKSKTILLDF